ncbi:MAG: hypothetical protein ACJ8MO_44260 [Bacillus sp. (in: firmicutes)]
MMKMKYKLAIPLLLAFLAFTFINSSTYLSHSHTAFKAIINADDGPVKGQWNDEKKQPVDVQILLVFTTILLAATVSHIYLAISFVRAHFFLIPIFHQSNYVILLPNKR